jgi:hypothetical protein
LDLFDERVNGKFQNVFNGEEIDFGTSRMIGLKGWEYLVLKNIGV